MKNILRLFFFVVALLLGAAAAAAAAASTTSATTETSTRHLRQLLDENKNQTSTAEEPSFFQWVMDEATLLTHNNTGTNETFQDDDVEGNYFLCPILAPLLYIPYGPFVLVGSWFYDSDDDLEDVLLKIFNPFTALLFIIWYVVFSPILLPAWILDCSI